MLLFESGDRVLFTGDSVTDAGRDRNQPVSAMHGMDVGLGNGYVRTVDTMLNVWYPERLIAVANTGISGDTSRGLLARWQTDVLDWKPDYVVVCIGFNDVWRQMDSPAITSMHVLPEEYAENLRGMIRATKDKVRGMIFMTPYYLEPQREDRMRAMMDEYGALCKQVCVEFGVRCIDLQADFDDYLQYHHSSFIMWDRVHPGCIGSMIIARRFLNEVGFDRPLVPAAASRERERPIRRSGRRMR